VNGPQPTRPLPPTGPARTNHCERHGAYARGAEECPRCRHERTYKPVGQWPVGDEIVLNLNRHDNGKYSFGTPPNAPWRGVAVAQMTDTYTERDCKAEASVFAESVGAKIKWAM
jgi:hypothetical protein